MSTTLGKRADGSKRTSRYEMLCFEGDKYQRYYLLERGRQIDHIPYSKEDAKTKLTQLRKQERKEARA